MPEKNDLAFLHLLHLADSALPIGTTAHSFGLETLVAEGWLCVDNVERFLRAYLSETGLLECTFCLLGHALGTGLDETLWPARSEAWRDLNARLGAFKMARESREASVTLGRRLLRLALDLDAHPLLASFVEGGQATHHCLAFGLLGGLLELDAGEVSLAYLRQTLASLVSACQRLLPLGQSRAGLILWHLHSAVLATAERSSAAAAGDEDVLSCFTTLVDLGSMLHPALPTRLFIS